MEPVIQETFDQERIRLGTLWFPDDRTGKRRPDISRFEVHAPQGKSGKWRFVAVLDILGETRRLEMTTDEPSQIRWDMAAKLEELYQLRLDFLLLSEAAED